MIAVAVLGTAQMAHPAEWVQAAAQIDEGRHGDSPPADKTQVGSQADLLGFAIFPISILPPDPQPAFFDLWWLVTGACRPGHRNRIDRPPRSAA